MAPVWISEQEVCDLIDLVDAIDVVSSALRSWSAGAAWTMRKAHARWGAGSTLHAIGGGLDDRRLVGSKTWAHTTGGAGPLLVLFDERDGGLVAVIEAFALGQLRTAAVTGVATDRMAASDAKVAAMIGTGRQALAQLSAVAAVRAVELIRVWSPTAEHRDRLGEQATALGIGEVVVSSSLVAAVEGADIITTATRAREPFLYAEHASHYPHINAIGAITPERCELAPDLVTRCQPIVADDPETAPALTAELAQVESILPLAELVASAALLPRAREAPSLFKAVGIGLADVAIGAAVLDRAIAAGAGRTFDAPRRTAPTLMRARARGQHALGGGARDPASNTGRDVLLVGSIPLGDAEDVFRVSSSVLGSYLRRIPDGETGPARSLWLQCQIPVLMTQRQLECVMPDGRGGWQPAAIPAHGIYSTTRAGFFAGRFRPRGSTDKPLRIESLGYADWARDSYEVFQRLKQNGTVPAKARFQVCLPTPTIIGVFAVPDHQAELRDAYQRGLFAEIQRILNHIPADDLAIQWDCTEPCVYESATREVRMSMLDALAQLADPVAEEVELGYHLCYGDFEHQHSVQPTDLSALVEIANGLTTRVPREISWIHMPVPRDRDDHAYFAPLSHLDLKPTTQVFLGLVHAADGEAGSRRRMGAASAIYDSYGLATECGFGRRISDTIPDLLRLHAQLAAEVAPAPEHRANP